MAEGIRVRIGSDIRFLPPSAKQPAAAYASVVKDNGPRNADGILVKGEPTWYEAKWTGVHADALVAKHVEGDALVLIGNATEQIGPSTDGVQRLVHRFFVNAFGSDAARSDGRGSSRLIAERWNVKCACAKGKRNMNSTRSVSESMHLLCMKVVPRLGIPTHLGRGTASRIGVKRTPGDSLLRLPKATHRDVAE